MHSYKQLFAHTCGKKSGQCIPLSHICEVLPTCFGAKAWRISCAKNAYASIKLDECVKRWERGTFLGILFLFEKGTEDRYIRDLKGDNGRLLFCCSLDGLKTNEWGTEVTMIKHTKFTFFKYWSAITERDCLHYVTQLWGTWGTHTW